MPAKKVAIARFDSFNGPNTWLWDSISVLEVVASIPANTPTNSLFRSNQGF